MNSIHKYLFILAALTGLSGCSDDYLEEKPIQSQIVPTSLSEYEALLNNSELMNVGTGLGVLGVDDFFIHDEAFESISNTLEKYSYVWAPGDLYRGQEECPDWTTPYKQVYYANNVLDALPRIEVNAENKKQYDQLKGRALFHRAWGHYQLAQLFCAAYNAENLSSPGIPLRLDANVTTPVVRASIEETYAQIIRDVAEAEALLPEQVSIASIPSKAAANAFHAMISLAMGNYQDAESFASEALAINNTLLDFNTLNPSANRPVPFFNEEIIFNSISYAFDFSFSPQTYIDTMLYDSYDEDDLRKVIFFRPRDINRYSFKGNFSGSLSLFTGIANDEVFLTRAEARARLGNFQGAMDDLNSLLVTRWKAGTYVAFTATNAEEALNIILTERRKELLFRPSRWTDMRRLNQEPAFQRTMKRKLNGVEYTLPPNDNRYVYPIPPGEIEISKIAQNPR